MTEEREAGRREERERIARRLEEEADVTPCVEDAVVYRSAATLVRADFSYDGAEQYEDALAVAERRLAALKAALQRLGSMEAFARAGLVDPERDAELIARIDYARRALAPAPAAEYEDALAAAERRLAAAEAERGGPPREPTLDMIHAVNAVHRPGWNIEWKTVWLAMYDAWAMNALSPAPAAEGGQ